MNNQTAEIRFNETEGVIDFYLRGNWIYDIDLNRFRNPAEALDWIRQISQKRWASKQTISEICTLALGVINGN